MPWQTPKTDWAVQPYGSNGEYAGDWFSVDVDYPRVTGNIGYLSEFSHAEIADMPEQDYTVEGPLAGIFNNIENNIDALANVIHRPTDFPATKTWTGNQYAPTVEDWNRWEQCLQTLYDYAHSIEGNKKRLPIRMNGGRF